HAGLMLDQPGARGGTIGVSRENRVVLDRLDAHGARESARELVRHGPPGRDGRGSDHCDLAQAGIALGVDRKPGAVGPALAELEQHRRRQTAKLGLERRVLEEQADNSAHAGPYAGGGPHADGRAAARASGATRSLPEGGMPVNPEERFFTPAKCTGLADPAARSVARVDDDR